MYQEQKAVRILIVEDFHAETEVLLRELIDSELPHALQIVSTESDFLRELVEFNPDVVLSPYSLKGTNAVKLLGLARELSYDVPFILLAFDLSEDIAIDLLAEGIEDYIQRGTVKRLPVAIRKALQRHKTQLELKLSEARLRASEASARNMVRNAPIAMAMFDLDMRYLVVSESWLRYANLKEEDLIGRYHYDIVPNIPQHWKDIHQACLQGAEHESEGEPFQPLDGSEVYVRWKMNPWYDADGQIGGVVLFIEDITERMRTGSELLRSQASLISAQRIAKLGSWEWGVGSDSVWWSEEMYRIYELDEGTPISIDLVRSYVHPDDRDRVERLTAHDLGDEIIPVIEYRMLLPSGKVKHVISSAQQVIDPKGLVTRLIGTLQDNTEKVLEQERANAERLQRELAIKASKIGVWHWQMNANELVWDERCFQIFGIPTRPLDPQDFVAFIHPEDRDRVQNLIGLSLSSGQFNAEYRILHPDGFRFIHAEASVTFNARKVPVRMDGIILDLTNHYLLETTLKQREQLFRDMAESITEVFWLTDWELNKVLYVSPRYETLYGMSVHSLYEDSKSWVQHIHPDDGERVSRSFRENAVLGKYDEEYRLLLPDGTLKWVRDRAFPIFNPDGTVSRLAGITEEITQQKADQDQLRTLSLVASETGNGVLIHAPDGTVVWANKGFERITGYSPSEIIGKEPWQLVSSPDTNWKLVEMTYRKIRDGKPFTSDNVLRHKDGRNVWVNTAFAPIFNDKAELVTIVSIGTDITRQKELEGLQRNLVGELEKRVSERTEQLNAINEELRSEIWEKQRLSDELYHQSIDLNDSLQYAKRIQESLLPQQEAIHRSFSDHFILFLPRNVVSGDLYWHHRTDDLSFFATIDCTGHGVPGALMSMIANELMNQAIIQRSMDDLSEILNFMNKLVVRTLRQKTGGAMRDGMDLSLIKIDHKTDSLWFAGAFNNAYLVHNGQLNTLSGSRFSIGGHLDDGHKSFQIHQIPLCKGDTIYLTTDGYIDQFGGPNGKKFMKKRFEELLLELNDGALCDQKETLLQTLHEWMGPQQQVDDILVVGLRY